MASLNKVQLIGNLGNAPEVRSFPDGSRIATVSLATNDRWKDKQTGESKERSEWHNVVFAGPVVATVEKYLEKGATVYIEGRLQTREWEKDGVKRYTTEVIVDMGGTMQLLGGKDGDGTPRQQRARREAGNGSAQRPAANSQQSQQAAPPDFDDDIPFREAHYLSGI